MNQIKKYGIIGLGKVGLTLARNLHARNLLEYICSESNVKNSVTSEFENIKIYGDLNDVQILPEIIIIAKADNYIIPVIKNINDNFHEQLNGKIIIHLSGSKGKEVYKEFDNNGAVLAAAHPYQTFYYPDPKILKGIYWGVQSNSDFEEIEDIITGFGGNAVNLNNLTEREKIIYHASAVTVSNYLTTLVDLGKSIANLAGINPELFIKPIMETTLDNNFRNNNNADKLPLTGPIARGDIYTLKSHLLALTNHQWELKTYCLIGLATAERAHKSELIDDETYNKISLLLKKYI